MRRSFELNEVSRDRADTTFIHRIIIQYRETFLGALLHFDSFTFWCRAKLTTEREVEKSRAQKGPAIFSPIG
jgi:hypothetical protein